MIVTVTGGSGFIGQAVVAELARRGHGSVVFDRSTGDDITLNALARSDAVIHLAGMLGTAELFADPFSAIDVNIKGSLRVLESCRKHDMSYVGITMPQVWRNVYQSTKQCAQNLASAWHENYGVRVSHVRAFNVFGPGQAFGPGHPQKIVPTFSVAAWRGEELPVWGDGDQTVDLVHVDDVARMLVDALAFGNDQLFDAGTGHPTTVNDVAEMVTEVADSTSQIKYLPMRMGEVPTDIVAKGDGWDLLGWHPVFDMGRFNETVDWYREEAERVDHSPHRIAS